MRLYNKGADMNYFVKKYKTVKPAFKGGATNYKTINSTKKYVEYCLDIIDINALILVEKDWDTKADLRICLARAESKRDWNIKHPNFDSRDAAIIMAAVRHLPRQHMEEFNEKFR